MNPLLICTGHVLTSDDVIFIPPSCHTAWISWQDSSHPTESFCPKYFETVIPWTVASEKAMATHSSLAWKIPWTEEPDGLQSMGSLRVRHD